MLNDWDFAASYGEVMAGLHANAYLNVHSEDRIRLPFPWPDGPRAEQVTPEELAALKASLRARSALPD